MAIPNFTAQQEALLVEVAAIQAVDGFVTMTQVNNAITNNGASFKSAPDLQTVTLASGVATIERRAQLTYAALATEGGAATDTLTQIVGTGFNRGDMLLILSAQTGNQINLDTATGYVGKSFRWANTTDAVLTFYDGSSFVWLAQYPEGQIKAVSQAEYRIPGGGVQDITTYTEWMKTYYRDPATETLATGTITITAAAGASGGIVAYVDNGSGVAVEIGRTSYTAASSPNAQAALLDASINAGTAIHGYTSTVLGAILTPVAPVGTGADANAFLIELEVSGGMTGTDVDFVGGIDAAYANATLDNIFGGTEGQQAVVTNTMPANTITFSGAGNFATSAQGVLAAGASRRIIYDTTITQWTLYA